MNNGMATAVLYIFGGVRILLDIFFLIPPYPRRIGVVFHTKSKRDAFLRQM